jgi:radical SAM superfamily enzyme
VLALLAARDFDWQKASASTDLENLKGITYRSGSAIRVNPDRQLFLAHRKEKDFLDRYPSPYLNGLLDTPTLGILTARGCNQHCIYCNCALISKRTITTHSIHRVIAELDYLAGKIDPDTHQVVDIYDDTFTLLPGRALEICRRIIEHKIKLPLACSTRCDKVNEELLEAMKEAGFRSIAFSLESAVPRLLRLIGKVHPPYTPGDPLLEKEQAFIEKFKKSSAYAKKLGIPGVTASIMIGLPGETPEEGRHTVALIRSLGDNLDSYAHNTFQILPGTPVFFNHESYGMKRIVLDNRIHSITVHNYDTGRIEPAPRSHLQEAALRRCRFSIKALALSPSPGQAAGFFSKLILRADTITPHLVAWMQENLPINGSLIQVYSSLDKARQHHENNRQNLYKYISPTLFHPAFYQGRNSLGSITLTLLPMPLSAKPLGFEIQLANMRTGLQSPHPPTDPSHLIYLEEEREDALELHGLLARLRDREDPVQELFRAPPLPYLSSLCRWEREVPNCRSRETVMVDAHDKVRTCWNGTPIGKVGMAFEELWERLEALHQAAEKERDCPGCPQQAECARCLFPHPLSTREYCNLQRSGKTLESAQLLRIFDAFKEL